MAPLSDTEPRMCPNVADWVRSKSQANSELALCECVCEKVRQRDKQRGLSLLCVHFPFSNGTIECNLLWYPLSSQYVAFLSYFMLISHLLKWTERVMVRLLENESEDIYQMKRIIMWGDTETKGRTQAREWQTWEATREDVRTVSEWRRVKECSVGKGKKRVRRRAREACHSSVNEERSLREPLSSNSPVGQPHTHFTCRKLTNTYSCSGNILSVQSPCTRKDILAHREMGRMIEM